MNVKKTQTMNPSILKVIWLAMAQSHVIFGVVAYLVIAKDSQGVFVLSTAYILFGIALSSGLVAWLMYKRAAKIINERAVSEEENQEVLAKAFPAFILSWVVCETISINGLLMVTLLGAEALPTASILFVLGLGLHLLLRPRLNMRQK